MFKLVRYIYTLACFAHQGTPCVNFIQRCDEYQKREKNRFQRPRNNMSDSLKQEGEVAEMKQWIRDRNTSPFAILVLL